MPKRRLQGKYKESKMTTPIQFNPFKGVSGTEKIQEIQDKRNNIRAPETDMALPQLNMNQGQDQDGEIALDNFDFKLDKQIPKQ